MPPNDLGPEAKKLIARMVGPPPSDPRFKGDPIDLTRLDALALGDAWAVAQATEQWRDGSWVESLAAETARRVIEFSGDRDLALRGPACRDYLDHLAREVEKDPPNGPDIILSYAWRQACFALRRCIDLSFEGLGPAARRFLAVNDWRAMPHLAVALARLVDPSFEARALETLAIAFAPSPLLVDELRAVASLDITAIIAVADVIHPDRSELEAIGAAQYPLSAYPAYAAFAEAGLLAAAARARDIHDGKRPYASDKAFTLHESAVIARLARVALDRDEAWAPAVLDELFRKVSVAPTAAKTLPSQSVAIALGHAIEAFPTPEAVETLRVVLREVRHAGVKQKLQRNERGAARGLAGRPEIALRMPADQPLTKPQVATLTRCLDAGLALGMAMTHDAWRARFAVNAQTRGLAASLLWTLLDPTDDATTVLPVAEGAALTFRDVSGAIVEPDTASRVKLWHPLDATPDERDAWRDRVAVLRVKQPFKQAFREHYVVPDDELAASRTTMFSGHAVAARSFLGLARRERWSPSYQSLARSFGRWTAQIELADAIYPGCEGWTTIVYLEVMTSGATKPAQALLGDVPATALSEILRAVDLLVSASGFALSDHGREPRRETRVGHLARQPAGAMIEMRKQALERSLCGRDGMAALAFDARHLRLGPYAIHLATGRVTRDGEPVTVDVPKPPRLAAVPWLPHDERLLETIAHTALEIARREDAGAPIR